MKIAIISDIHGNYEALSRLPESYDELWVLGDLINYGPEPGAVIDFVRERCTLAVRGNHDHSVAYDEATRCSPRFTAMAEATRKFSISALSGAQRGFLRYLPLSARREAGGCRFFLCHATPSDMLYEYRKADSPLWDADLDHLDADVVLVGHTHLPFVRRLEDGRIVLNPGSLGQPKAGSPQACYAVWEDGVITLKKFSYPVEETIARLRSLALPAEVERDLEKVLQTGAAPT
jgi:putative phosphoesterase